MGIKFDLETYVELELEIEADYTPSRPAPHCQNPDSPKFSDPGDDEEFEYAVYFIVDEKLKDGTVKKKRVAIPDELYALINDQMEEEIRTNVEEHFGD